MGPPLFSAFSDDTGDEWEITLYLFAGDSNLFCEIRSSNDILFMSLFRRQGPGENE